jgi:hypothetical protein
MKTKMMVLAFILATSLNAQKITKILGQNTSTYSRDGKTYKVPSHRMEIEGIYNGKDLLREYKTGISAQQIAKQKSFRIQLTNLPKGGNEVRFGIRSKNYLPTHNSETIHVVGL